MGQDRQEVRYEISPDHIRFRTNDSESRFSWDRFLKWKERDGVILLYRSSKFFMIVPVELFEPDAADALRACLRANVTGG
ncbi:MAG: YcxB family protein [Pirellulaceae bacterium]|nr:YcxB family protein [Pirellulaceae bacterium]